VLREVIRIRYRGPRAELLKPVAAWAATILLSAAPAVAQTQAIRFGRLWDGSRLITDAVVIVEGDRIVRVESGAAAMPKGVEAMDLRRYTGIPGLIDVHTHMTYYWDRRPGTRPLGQKRRPAETVYLAQGNTRRTLETGVTTVRDLGASNENDLAMRDLINMGAMVGPRMFVSGQGLSSRAGATPDPGAMRRTTEERIKAGSDWIKVYASRGSYDSVDTTQTVTYDEMKAIVEAAHAANHKVAIHSYGPSGVKDAVRAGADSVEHGVDLDDETLAEMARQGIVWVPTIDHNRYYVDAREEFGFKPESIAPLQNYIERNLESARRAVKAGVRLAMGSDAVYTMFGQNTRELEWFVKAGMTPEQALKSATITGAELLGVPDRLGRVAPGFLADLVAVDGDPLQKIDVLFGGVRWVMKDGKVVVDKR
jgi:imidazolonepropionase-like amidohydrolase